MPVWFLYMVRCNDDSLYTGIATDVARRFDEHQAGKGAKYLRGKGPLQLAFAVAAGTRSQASRTEARVKRLAKGDKEALAEGRKSLAELGAI